MYKIRYLQTAQEDLKGITIYIALELKEPAIARKLVNLIEEKIRGLAEFPFMCREYQPVKPLEEKYRIMVVKNYLVLYVVFDDIVEIRHVVHGRMDYGKLL